MSDTSDFDWGYDTLQIKPSFSPEVEVFVAVGALLKPELESQWNDKNVLWDSAITDITFLMHSLFWEYIKSTGTLTMGGVLGSSKVKYVRYIVCQATITKWQKELCGDDEILCGVFHAEEHFTLILKNCTAMASGGEVLVSAAEVTEEFSEESKALLPGRTIVDSRLQQGDGDVCGACVSLVLKELMGFPLEQQSVESTANSSAIYLARVFFANLYFEGNVQFTHFDEDVVNGHILHPNFLPRSHPLFRFDKNEGTLGRAIFQLHENVLREKKKLRLRLKRHLQDKSGNQNSLKTPKGKKSPPKNNQLERKAMRQQQREGEKEKEAIEKAARKVAIKARKSILDMQQQEVNLFESDDDIPIPKRRKKSAGSINQALFGADDSESDNENVGVVLPTDDNLHDSKSRQSDSEEEEGRSSFEHTSPTQQVPREIIRPADQNLSFSNRNLGIICDVDWQPDPIPNASLLPEVDANEEICNSQMFMSDPKAKGKAFRFGSMYFVVVGGREGLGMTAAAVKDLLSTLFHPMRPVSPFVCHNCNLQFWNPVLHLEHLRSNWNCKNVRLANVKRIVHMNPKPVSQLYFVIDFEVYIFLQTAMQQLDKANLPMNMLNPCQYPLPAPCGGRPLPNLTIQEEVKREHEQLMKVKSFYDLHSKKLARLLKLSTLYMNSRKCKDWLRDRFMQYPLFLTMPFLNSNGFPDAVLVPKSASAKKSQDIEEMDDCQKFIVAFATTGEVNEKMLSLLE